MVEYSDARKGIYDQDQFYRYQDALMWGRLQTATTIEAAMLFGMYQSERALPGVELKTLALAGSLLVLAVCLVALKDASDAGRHLGRLKAFEKSWDSKLRRANGRATGLRLGRRRGHSQDSGNLLYRRWYAELRP